MSELTPSDDELVSSYLDGEATFDEAARVEGDPALRARAEEMRAARDLVATPVDPLRAGDLDRLLGAALDASTTNDDVLDLRAAAGRRPQLRHGLIAAAAAVLVLVVAVPTLLALGSFGDGDDAENFATGADAGDDRGAGDSADSGDTGGDDGDDDASLEAFAEDGGVDADSADAATLEMNDDAGDDSDDVDSAGGDEQAVPRAVNRIEILPDFSEPLDRPALIDVAESAWLAYSAEPGGGGVEAPEDEFVAMYPCAQEIIELLGPEIGVVDVSQVVLDGVETTVAIVEIEEKSATLFIAVPPVCAVEELAELTAFP